MWHRTKRRTTGEEQAEAEVPPEGALQHCLFNSLARNASHCPVFMEILAVTIMIMKTMSMTLLRCRQPLARWLTRSPSQGRDSVWEKRLQWGGHVTLPPAFYNHNQM